VDVVARCGGTRGTLREVRRVAGGESTYEYTVYWTERAQVAVAHTVLPALVAVTGLTVIALRIGMPPVAWLLVPFAGVAAYAVSRQRRPGGTAAPTPSPARPSAGCSRVRWPLDPSRERRRTWGRLHLPRFRVRDRSSWRRTVNSGGPDTRGRRSCCATLAGSPSWSISFAAPGGTSTYPSWIPSRRPA